MPDLLLCMFSAFVKNIAAERERAVERKCKTVKIPGKKSFFCAKNARTAIVARAFCLWQETCLKGLNQYVPNETKMFCDSILFVNCNKYKCANVDRLNSWRQ